MEKHDSIFPQGDKAPEIYFTGTVRTRNLSNDPAYNVVIVNVTFEPAARTNWHTHPGGQILLVTEGTCFYGEKGKPVQRFSKGEVINIPPDVLHWHGASPDHSMTHIAINTNAGQGTVAWLQPVSDEEYGGA